MRAGSSGLWPRGALRRHLTPGGPGGREPCLSPPGSSELLWQTLPTTPGPTGQGRQPPTGPQGSPASCEPPSPWAGPARGHTSDRQDGRRCRDPVPEVVTENPGFTLCSLSPAASRSSEDSSCPVENPAAMNGGTFPANGQQGTEALSSPTCEELHLANNLAKERASGPSPASPSKGTTAPAKTRLWGTWRQRHGPVRSDSQPPEPCDNTRVRFKQPSFGGVICYTASDNHYKALIRPCKERSHFDVGGIPPRDLPLRSAPISGGQHSSCYKGTDVHEESTAIEPRRSEAILPQSSFQQGRLLWPEASRLWGQQGGETGQVVSGHSEMVPWLFPNITERFQKQKFW